MRTGQLIKTDSRNVYVWLLATPLVAAGFSLVHMVRSIFVPYQLEYGEGLVVWQSLRITSPHIVYHPIDTYPFVVGMYPPAYLMTTHLVGAAIGDIQIGGRLVAFIATVVSAAMIAAIVLELLPSRFDRWTRWTGAIVAAALVLNLGNVRRWAPSARVDLPGIALCLVGVFLFLNGRRPGWKWFAAFGCFALAAFTKQSLVAAPAACLIVALFQSRRTSVVLGGFYASLLAASFGVMHAVTDGQFLRHLFVYTTQNTFSFLQVFELAGRNVGTMILLLVPACLAASIAVRRPQAGHAAKALSIAFKTNQARWGIAALTLYVVMAAIVSVTSGKNGAAAYYFMEWNIACCALVGVLIGCHLARWTATRRLWLVTVPLCVGTFGFISAGFAANQALRFTAGAQAQDRHRLSEFQEAVQVVRNLPSPVLAYDLTLMIQGGKEVSFEPFIMWELMRQGLWNAAPLVDQLSRRTYSAFVGETDLDYDGNMPQAMKAAILVNYPIVRKIGRYQFHLPDSSGSIEGTSSAPSIPNQGLP